LGNNKKGKKIENWKEREKGKNREEEGGIWKYSIYFIHNE
jgi:hypothetical protein